MPRYHKYESQHRFRKTSFGFSHILEAEFYYPLPLSVFSLPPDYCSARTGNTAKRSGAWNDHFSIWNEYDNLVQMVLEILIKFAIEEKFIPRTTHSEQVARCQHASCCTRGTRTLEIQTHLHVADSPVHCLQST